jgi:membrane protease YdiL (CAAX protease family)
VGGTTETAVAARSRLQRIAEAAAFVGAWMAIGFVLHLDVNAYLVIGVPLTVGFQVFVRRRPLTEAWVRGDAAVYGGAKRTALIAGVVAACAGVVVFSLITAPHGLVIVIWSIAALCGCVGLVYALRRANRETVRAGLHCLATGGTIGVLFVLVGTAFRATAHAFGRVPAPGYRAWSGFVCLAAYFAVSFVIEEVTFRGVLDAHVHHAGERRGVASAVYVSALWGLWHLPLAGRAWPASVLELLVVHVPTGVALSIFWRRSGNLAVPAFTHAFIDAVRNALIL